MSRPSPASGRDRTYNCETDAVTRRFIRIGVQDFGGQSTLFGSTLRPMAREMAVEQPARWARLAG